MTRLRHKVAVVTGGNSGIGLAISKRFVEEGAHVFIFGRREEELRKAAETIAHNVTWVQGDVTSDEDMDRLYAAVKAEKGHLDVIVTSAGAFHRETISEPSTEWFERLFAINVAGTYRSIHKGVAMLADGGSIVLVSSNLNAMGQAGWGAYAATKAAIRSFSRSWAAELKERGIRVNTLSPGITDTPIIDLDSASPEEAADKRRTYPRVIPLGRMGRPEEIAAAAPFLACDESSFCTGTELVADGGQLDL